MSRPKHEAVNLSSSMSSSESNFLSMSGEHRPAGGDSSDVLVKKMTRQAPRVLAGRQLRSAMELELFLVPLAVQLTAANQGVC